MKNNCEKKILIKNGTIESIKKRDSPCHVISVIQNVGSTQSMSAYLGSIDVNFDFPKPIGLVFFILEFIDSKDSRNIVLDFFCGLRHNRACSFQKEVLVCSLKSRA